MSKNKAFGPLLTVQRMNFHAHPASNVGVEEVLHWMSSREGKEFIGFLGEIVTHLCNLFHTDDFQKALYRYYGSPFSRVK